MALFPQTFRQFDPPFRIEAGIVSRCCVSQEIALKEHRVGELNDRTGMYVVPMGPVFFAVKLDPRDHGPPREADRFLEVDELDRSEVVEAVDARADGGAPGRVAYGGGEPRVDLELSLELISLRFHCERCAI